ncbi:hypothetical protein EDC01DRAFT_753901 [Geopyxis carbonaria]|nr:hypothetical protein EDC01DRAFT_753901 [Geopyxis carbonaria]
MTHYARSHTDIQNFLEESLPFKRRVDRRLRAPPKQGPFSSLPPKIFLNIAEYLDNFEDFNSLRQTTHATYSLLGWQNSPIYRPRHRRCGPECASFSSLPTELILEISEHLGTLRDFSSLAQTTRATYSLLRPTLIREAAASDLHADTDSVIPAKTVLRWAAIHNSTLAHELTVQIHNLQPRKSTQNLFSGALLAAVAAPKVDHDTIALFLKEGADPERVWKHIGITALIVAVELERYSVVDLLLRQRLVKRPPGRSRFTPLHVAVWRDDALMVRTIIKADPGSVDRRINEDRVSEYDYSVISVTAVEMAVRDKRDKSREAFLYAGLRVEYPSSLRRLRLSRSELSRLRLHYDAYSHLGICGEFIGPNCCDCVRCIQPCGNCVRCCSGDYDDYSGKRSSNSVTKGTSAAKY